MVAPGPPPSFYTFLVMLLQGWIQELPVGAADATRVAHDLRSFSVRSRGTLQYIHIYGPFHDVVQQFQTYDSRVVVVYNLM